MKSTLHAVTKITLNVDKTAFLQDVVEEAWLVSQTFKITVDFEFNEQYFTITPETHLHDLDVMIKSEETLSHRDNIADFTDIQPVAFYANGSYYNTVKAALKDGAEEVIPLYDR